MTQMLAAIDDFDRLAKMLEEAPHGSAPAKIIKERMTQMLAAITASAIPEWFTALLRHPDRIPFFVLSLVNQKATELAS